MSGARCLGASCPGASCRGRAVRVPVDVVSSVSDNCTDIALIDSCKKYFDGVMNLNEKFFICLPCTSILCDVV